MVEIIERNEPKKYTIKCCRCGSILRFSHLDEKSEYNPDVPFEGQATDWTVQCPNCNHKVPTHSLTDRGYYEWRCEDYKEENTKQDEIWSWNETDDDWSHGTFDSREEALEDALGNIDDIKSYLETDTPIIYLGKCEYVPLPTNVDSERILMNLDESYCDETGCEEYIFEGVTEEQTKWLEDKLSELMLEFYARTGLKSNWFTVVEQEEIDLCEYEKEKK